MKIKLTSSLVQAAFCFRSGQLHLLQIGLIGFLALQCGLPLLAQKPLNPLKTAPSSRMLLAHYMPWYEAHPSSGKWGWHWTMNHFQPKVTHNSRPEVASHYLPLLGLYDSGDPDLLETHVLLMKFAGIDGVIVDWYGTETLYDYPILHRNTQRLIPILERAGLKFATCFEDQTAPNLIAQKVITAEDSLAYGKRMVRWLADHWFKSPAYLREDGSPVLLVFGGGYYHEPEWRSMLTEIAPAPRLYTELGRRAPAVGAFGWPVPNEGTEKGLENLADFYRRGREWETLIGAAYPRFHDIYAEAGAGKSWGVIEDRDGKTYTETLEQALQSPANIIQVATWNDWGEGTMIEPSVEFGFRDLIATQKLRRKQLDPKFSCTAADLKLPMQLYDLRKRAASPAQLAELKRAADLLFAGKTAVARTLLSRLARTAGPRAITP